MAVILLSRLAAATLLRAGAAVAGKACHLETAMMEVRVVAARVLHPRRVAGILHPLARLRERQGERLLRAMLAAAGAAAAVWRGLILPAFPQPMARMAAGERMNQTTLEPAWALRSWKEVIPEAAAVERISMGMAELAGKVAVETDIKGKPAVAIRVKRTPEVAAAVHPTIIIPGSLAATVAKGWSSCDTNFKTSMAYFAEIDGDNIVIRVVAIADRDTADSDGNEVESVGVGFCEQLLGGAWKQTSYNTRAGVHALDGTPFRKNYAGKGYEWREDLDGFVPPRLFDSWHLEPETCDWEPPVPHPEDADKDKRFRWDEENLGWVEVEKLD
jgi:hypothetical protein